MAEPGVEQHKGVEVGVVGCECSRLVQRVVVLHKRADLQLVADAVLDDGAEGVGGRAGRQGKLGVAVCHRFGADEDQVEGDAREEVRELDPDFARQGGFGAGAEDEEADRRGSNAGVLPCVTTTASWGMESVSQSCINVSALQL